MLTLTEHGKTLEIAIDRPPANALNPALVSALREAIGAAPAKGFLAISLTGKPGMFSAGLDVPELLELDEAGMTRFWEDFFALLKDIAMSPIPIAAGVTGHSPAGGAVMCLFADYRVMAEGSFAIGLNEVRVGLTIPPVIANALRRLVGTRHAEQMLVSGAMLNPEQALEVGLVDELKPMEDVAGRALAWCKQLVSLPQHAVAATRQLMRADLAALFDDPESMRIEAFVSFWFREETQAALHSMVAALKKRG